MTLLKVFRPKNYTQTFPEFNPLNFFAHLQDTIPSLYDGVFHGNGTFAGLYFRPQLSSGNSVRMSVECVLCFFVRAEQSAVATWRGVYVQVEVNAVF